MIDPDHTLSVLSEVAEERSRQDETWGQQDYPVHDRRDPDGSDYWSASFGTMADNLKALGKRLGKDDNGMRILLEEVFEAGAETSPVKIREELVQVAAVAVMIAESLDRAEAKKHGPGCELGLYHGGDCGPSAILRAARMNVPPVPETFLRRVVGPLDLTEFQTQFLDRVMRAPVSQDCPFCQNAYLSDRLVGHINEAHAFWVSRLDQVRSLADHIREDHPADEHGSRGPLMPGEEIIPASVFRQEREGRVTLDPDSPVPGLVEVTFRDGPMKLTDVFKKKIIQAVNSGSLPVTRTGLAHPWGGAGRLHGICRCGEGRDASVHHDVDRSSPCHPWPQDTDFTVGRCVACDGPYCLCGRVFLHCPFAETNGSGGHNWQHPTPSSGLVCTFCQLAHKNWSGESCGAAPEPSVKEALVSVDEIHRTGGPGPEVARLAGLMKAVEEGRAGTPVPQVCGQEGCGPDYCPGGKQCRAMALGKADTSGD